MSNKITEIPTVDYNTLVCMEALATVRDALTQINIMQAELEKLETALNAVEPRLLRTIKSLEKVSKDEK